ncbi:MAG: glycosyltransferase [Cytophaga sp.]|uniref:glycosyltransferase n=1 Tax=Cytophaga sp. TaxID=29535 RepID=UPI003F7E1B3B
MKPKILHIIDSFSKGGAEVLLSGIVPELYGFEHHIIYLTYTQYPLNEKLPPFITLECLNYTGLSNTFAAIKKLKRRIAEIKPDIIHTHLYFSTIFTRFAAGDSIPVIHTYHSQYYRIQYIDRISKLKRWCLKWIDKLTYKERYTIVHVSQTQQKSNDADIGIKRSSILYNYVEDDFYRKRSRTFDKKNGKLKIISVGNLKTEKNHILLLQAVNLLKHIPMHVNICGQGIDHRMLQEYINRHSLPVTIHGSKNDITNLLEQHDLFVSCSIIEGFGISVAEAMAAEIPMIISDISTFREITENKACFFKSADARDLADKIELFYNASASAEQYVRACKNVAEKYRKAIYINKLNILYQSKINVHHI